MEKRKLWLIFILLFILLVLFISCNSESRPMAEEAAVSEDSVSASPVIPVTGDKQVYEQIPEERQGEVTSQPEKLIVRKYASSLKSEGSLVYYCPRRMLENTDNNVSVTITKAALAKAIANMERRIAETSNDTAAEIHESTGGSAVTISRKMKVELKFSDDDFHTIYKPENDDQIFDGENDLNWDWIIRPLNVGSAQLSIIVSAFDENNQRWVAAQTPPKIFDIKVQVDPRGYFSKLWGFLGANPEWLLTQLLFPLIAFFYGKRQGKKITD
ncbi:MAG: hypothetical protein JNK09_05685 [Prolixibacteraceae bacterium]|nr:hypothetical protein [Prolixibacteraceae bacterium]